MLGSPPIRPDWMAWAGRLMAGDWTGEQPWLVTHFNLMGLWPLAWLTLATDDLRGKPVPGLLPILGTMVLGAFVLLPWLALRQEPSAERGILERVTAAPPLPAFVGLAAVSMIGWAVANGDVAAWDQARAADGFVYIMTLDFGALWLASLLVAKEQGEALGSHGWRLAVFPLVGAMAWVLLRERLIAAEAEA